MGFSTADPVGATKDNRLIIQKLSWPARGREWIAPVGVETQNLTYSSRINVIPTLAGLHIDTWGPGIGRLQLSGSTGYNGAVHARTLADTAHLYGTNGQIAYDNLRALITDYLNTMGTTGSPDLMPLEYHDWYSNIYVKCVPDQQALTTQQHRSEPLLKRWQLSLIVIADLVNGSLRALTGPTTTVAASVSSSAAAQAVDILLARTSPLASNPTPWRP